MNSVYISFQCSLIGVPHNNFLGIIKVAMKNIGSRVCYSKSTLAHTRPMLQSCRNSSIDMHCKSIDWFCINLTLV